MPAQTPSSVNIPTCYSRSSSPTANSSPTRWATSSGIRDTASQEIPAYYKSTSMPTRSSVGRSTRIYSTTTARRHRSPRAYDSTGSVTSSPGTAHPTNHHLGPQQQPPPPPDNHRDPDNDRNTDKHRNADNHHNTGDDYGAVRHRHRRQLTGHDTCYEPPRSDPRGSNLPTQ